MRKLFPLLLTLALLLGACGAPAAAAEPYSGTFFAMDTVMTLTLYPPDREGPNTVDAAKTLVQYIEHLLSATDPDSDLYAVNAHGGGTVTAETGEVLAEALRLCDFTGGALDVTMYPVSLAWGFTTENHRVPSRDELDALLRRVDYRRVAVDFDTEGSAAVTLPEGMLADLGAVAKGYAADRLRELLLDRLGGQASALLDLGGNVVALGAKPDGSPWRVGIRDPENPDGILGVVRAADLAVVTSGGYERYFEENGVRYWHILDPATGEPARSGLKSVTVVGRSGAGTCMTYDALSTAVFVMGPERAAQFWREHSAEAHDFDLILVDDNGGVTITEGIRDSFTLSGRWQSAPLTVLTKEN